ncbi:MAG TPA: beta-N-acetylhexosaminidase [Candidatus Sulfotelmatobacter sp.]|nr:beta-N-acetylhexosaminidase [Candidatus Sulfotelmatobacter sp.]
MSARVGQVMIVGFDGVEMTPPLASLLRRLQPAGVILFARNIKSPEQTWRLVRECQDCVEVPLFRCVDLEGGTVDRFRDVLGATPAAAEVFAADDLRVFRKHGQIIGENCRALGFNVDFAPVLDLAFSASQSVMDSRAVSADPEQTAGYGREFLAGLVSARVLGCGKHFPGLGEGKLDSHHELPVIEKSMKRLWEEDLLPYRMLSRQLPMVMISHAAYPTATKSKIPASLSKFWIADTLRKRIGYRGLVLSDDLEMGGVLSAAPVGEAAVEFVRAGGDVCLVCHREDYVLQAHQALAKAAEKDKKFARRVAESSRKVLAFKQKWKRALRLGKAPTEATVEKLTRRLWEFGEQVRLGPLSRREDRRRRA